MSEMLQNSNGSRSPSERSGGTAFPRVPPSLHHYRSAEMVPIYYIPQIYTAISFLKGDQTLLSNSKEGAMARLPPGSVSVLSKDWKQGVVRKKQL